MRVLIKYFLAILIYSFSVLSSAQPQNLSFDAKISVLTCGTGDDLHATFGHTALRVQDIQQDIDVVFNYGTFNFSTPNFYLKFIKGDLLYQLSVSTFDDFFSYYKHVNRRVSEQELYLTAEQKQKVWKKILHQFNTSERYYTYKFIDNNCTTKVADVINDVLQEPLKVSFKQNNANYRTLLNEYLTTNYFAKLSINLIFGQKVNHLSTSVFLPSKLEKSLEISTNGSHKIVAQESVLYQGIEKSNFNFFNSIGFLFLICFILGFLILKNWFRKSWFIILGFLGCFFLGVWLYSFHKEVYYNNVVLFCNPMFLFYVFIKNKTIRKSLLAAIFGLFVIYLFWISLEVLWIFSPLLLLTIVVFFQELKTEFSK